MRHLLYSVVCLATAANNDETSSTGQRPSRPSPEDQGSASAMPAIVETRGAAQENAGGEERPIDDEQPQLGPADDSHLKPPPAPG